MLAEPGGEITAWRDDLSKHRAYRARGLVGELLPHVSIEDEHVFARLLRGRRGRFAESQLEHAVRSEDHLVRIAAARHCLARSVLRVVEELERPGDGLRAEVRGEAIGGIGGKELAVDAAAEEAIEHSPRVANGLRDQPLDLVVEHIAIHGVHGQWLRQEAREGALRGRAHARGLGPAALQELDGDSPAQQVGQSHRFLVVVRGVVRRPGILQRQR